MNKFIVWLAGGEQEVKEIKEIGLQIAEYGIENIILHPRGGIKIKRRNQISNSDIEKLNKIKYLSNR